MINCPYPAVPVLGTFHVTLTDIYLEGLDVEETKTGLALGPDGAFILLVENLQVSQLQVGTAGCVHLARLSPTSIMTMLQAPDDRSGCIPTLLFCWVANTYRLAQLQANVKAKFQYQRTTFPQVSGDGSAYVTSVGGHAKLGIRVANDGVGHPLVRLDIPMTTRPCLQTYPGPVVHARLPSRTSGHIEPHPPYKP